MFFMQDNDFTLFGASPESSLKYDATSRQIEIYRLPALARVVVVLTVRLTATLTAESSWRCVPTIKSFLST